MIASSSPLAFSAGADLKAVRRSRGSAKIASLVDSTHELFATFAGGELVTIAAVNALGVWGRQLVRQWPATLRIAAASAIFAQPEIKLGIIPGWGARTPSAASLRAGWPSRQPARRRALLAGEALDHWRVNCVVAHHQLLDTAPARV